MHSSRKLLAILFWMALGLPAALAQSSATAAPTATDVTIIIQQEKVRFTARAAVAEMRLQVFDQAGEVVYDSGPVAESTLDWPLQNGNGQTLKSGLYAYSLAIREAGKEPGAEPSRPRRGHFIVDRAGEQDGKTDHLWVTAQNDGGVGAELTVIRDETSTVAGAAMSSGAGARTVGQRAGNSSRDAAGRTVEAETQGPAKADKAAVTAAAAGTIGQIAKFTSTTEVGNSVLIEQNANIGIGAVSPKHRLSIAGGPLWTSNSWSGALELQNGAALAWEANTGGQRAGIGHTNGGTLFFRTNSDPGTVGGPAIYDMTINDVGNVGIGTTTPSNGIKLEVNGQTLMTPGGSGGAIQFGTPNGETGMSIVGTRRADLRFDGSALKLAVGPVGGPPDPRNGIVINASGNVGIGTVTPATKLHVESSGYAEMTLKSTNERAILALSNGLGPSNYVWTVESGVRGLPGLFGIYNRTVNKSGLEIDGNLLVYVKALQITGGADFAENFDVRDGASASTIQPGMVVAIDPIHPGKLSLSHRAYDKRVAGIISGAGDVKPGMRMGQAGTLADGSHPVALSGRVYVWVDATRGAIRPGDLLTTSATPGHAMKAANPARAQGAILGKAMTGLNTGKGLVLVLVTLQ